MGQVPTMIVTFENGGQLSMTQSLAVIEYLDETTLCDETSVRLLPTCPKQRFKARELAQIIGTGIQPVQNLSVLKRVVAWTGEKENKLKWGKEIIDIGFKVPRG